ncbi:MAG: GNAT family N-acetyltransferase [Betaproteobacteria bacterium]
MSPIVRADVPLDAIDASAWDALSGAHPFLLHAFLSALHESGCASPRTGWTPRYLTAWSGGALAGALPLYAKMHSYGEYVFDWGWADAYRRHGQRYYPKLVAAIPFTPVTGPRALGADAATRRALYAEALRWVADGSHSSLHALFPPASEASELEGAGWILRRGLQFHWSNAGWRDFADFLASFSHDKRKKIRQDRQKLARAGVAFERKSGSAMSAADWAFVHRCYTATYHAHRSTPYLTRDAFERIGAALGDRVVLVTGTRAGARLCSALDVTDGTTMWGRYWGAVDYVPGMHFEACYYQAIEHCLEHGIARFEGGAQGLHKLSRGLDPATTWSAHWIGDRGFRAAIAEFCAREEVEVAGTLDELMEARPYRKGDGDGGR